MMLVGRLCYRPVDREIQDVTFERFVDDLEAVVDAAGIDRFALLGISQGCAVSIAYAVRHPERVSHLVLLGGYAVGWKKRARSEAEKEAGRCRTHVSDAMDSI